MIPRLQGSDVAGGFDLIGWEPLCRELIGKVFLIQLVLQLNGIC